MKKTLFVTGGAGFIGSSFVRKALQNDYNVVVIDKLTYAGRRENIQEFIVEDGSVGDAVDLGAPILALHVVDINDFEKIKDLYLKYEPVGMIHMAAESHVDNSIAGPKIFMETNIQGTFNLLEAARWYFSSLNITDKKHFRFVHVSTDEVFGELGEFGFFNEQTAYAPNSPYSASKAASDHLVRAWQRTYGIPAIVTNCSNNYGPRQFPEKLIPKTIIKALSGETIPVYGAGLNIRDWIHVEDHCAGIFRAFQNGVVGETYCFGGNSERKNIDVVNEICRILDRKTPKKTGRSYSEQIAFVEDRLGHDARYAIDDEKAFKSLGYVRQYPNFEIGLEKTIDWYLKNPWWLKGLGYSTKDLGLEVE